MKLITQSFGVVELPPPPWTDTTQITTAAGTQTLGAFIALTHGEGITELAAAYKEKTDA